MIASDESHTVELTGLDGSNPLAFLAALGTLRVLSERCQPERVQMIWRLVSGKWTPVVIAPVADCEDLVEALWDSLSREDECPWNIDKKLPFSARKFRETTLKAASMTSSLDRTAADKLAALGSDVVLEWDANFPDTAFRMVRSGDAAGQGMLDYALKIKQHTTVEDIREALLGKWQYSARGPSLRWDPLEAREYALLASDPSKGGVLSVIGANRLALQALPLFPTCPSGAAVATVGFRRQRRESELTWPLWNVSLTLDVVRSLLTHPILHEETPSPRDLRAMGVAAVYRSTQYKPNQYYLNFAPARSV